jgi:hypothetical protein
MAFLQRLTADPHLAAGKSMATSKGYANDPEKKKAPACTRQARASDQGQ